MRIKSRFSLWAEPDEAKEYFTIIGNHSKDIPSERTFISLEVFNDSPEYDCLRKAFERYGQDPYELKDQIFTSKELSSALILRMVPNSHYGGYPQPETNVERGFLGVSYDLEAGCPYCTKGMLQNRPLRLKSGIKMGKRSDISGIWWIREYIVTSRAKQIIEENRLSGCEFWPVIQHGKDTPFEGIFQLKITGELPAMASQTVFNFDPLDDIPRACKNGHGWTSIEGRVHYQASDLIDVPDFALTKEWLGGNGELWRWPFMSQKAYRVFKENKINGVRFYPPAIVDE